MLLNIKCPPTKQAKSQGNSEGTKTPSGDRMEKKNLGKKQTQFSSAQQRNSV